MGFIYAIKYKLTRISAENQFFQHPAWLTVCSISLWGHPSAYYLMSERTHMNGWLTDICESSAKHINLLPVRRNVLIRN